MLLETTQQLIHYPTPNFHTHTTCTQPILLGELLLVPWQMPFQVHDTTICNPALPLAFNSQ